MFSGRTLLIATKHEKESVIAPLLKEYLNVTCVVNTDFDTDTLGTFSGEIERKLDVVETLRQKCLQAVSLTNFDLVVASEGSFGPHPTLFFATADDELIMFKDLKNNIEILERHLSTDTNFDGVEVKNIKSLIDFAIKIGFPSHGIILKSSKNNPEVVVKDLENLEELEQAFKNLNASYPHIFAETDMRAHKNPTRMEVIKQATRKLVEKINTLCPKCKFPGFEVIQVNTGLPCGLCGSETKSTLSYVFGCKSCNYSEQKLYPFDKKTEDPMYCDFCNP